MTQHYVLPNMGEMAALQRHHSQSNSTFPTPYTVFTPGDTRQHQESGWACKNTSASIHIWLFFTHNGQVHGLTLTIVSFTIKIMGFCQSASWQCAIHTASKERGGDYHTMASCLFYFWLKYDLPAGTLAEAHTIWLWIKKRYDLPRKNWLIESSNTGFFKI